MKIFNFPFEKILRLKVFNRKVKELEFKKIAAKINYLRMQIQKNKFILNTALAIEDASMNIMYRKYYDFLSRENNYYDNEIQKLLPEFNKRKAEYTEKRKEEKTFEKLKEKMVNEYKKEELKEEQQILDEVALTEYRQKINGV